MMAGCDVSGSTVGRSSRRGQCDEEIFDLFPFCKNVALYQRNSGIKADSLLSETMGSIGNSFCHIFESMITFHWCSMRILGFSCKSLAFNLHIFAVNHVLKPMVGAYESFCRVAS